MNDQPLTDDLDLQGARSREDLAVLLRKLHARADSLTLRVLADWAIKHRKPSLAKATVSDMLSAKRLAKKGTMLAFVEACGIPAAELTPWRHAWERVASNEHDRPSLDAELDRLKQAAQTRADDLLQRAEESAHKLHLNAQTEIGHLTGEAQARADALLQRVEERAEEAEVQRQRVIDEVRARVEGEAQVFLEESRRKAEQEVAEFRREEEARVRAHIEALQEKAELEAHQRATHFVDSISHLRDGDRMDTAARVLAIAQHTCDQAIADANREADETRAQGRRDTLEILQRARHKALAILSGALHQTDVLKELRLLGADAGLDPLPPPSTRPMP